MALPGFTADASVYRSRRRYRTASTAQAYPNGVLPQQDAELDGLRPGHCCGRASYCAGLCLCIGGQQHCMGSHVDEDPMPTILKATDSVAMAIDACHADVKVNGGYAYAVCDCGCWATTHDAGCLICSHAEVKAPATILKA